MKRIPHPAAAETHDMIEFSDGRQIQAPRWTSPKRTEPVVIADSVLGIIDERLTARSAIHQDPHLSSAGRAHKSRPVDEEILGRVAAGWSQVETFARHIDNREAALLALPTLDPTAAAVAVEDRECRDWWRALPTEEKARMLASIDAEPEKHQRLAIALLRSPLPLAMLDGEVNFVRDVWNRGRRAGNPEEAAAIDEGRAAVAYAKEVLLHTAAVAQHAIGASRDAVVDTLTTNKLETGTGYRAFGFSDQDAAASRQRVEALGVMGRAA
jgi:hypothetical protein